MSLIDAIKFRRSYRDYIAKPIEENKLEIIRNCFDIKTPFNNAPKFYIFNIPEEQIKNFSTYGMIKGAKVFIVGKVTKNPPNCYIDYGWALEYIILKATELGLGTCWLGGTLDRNFLKNKLELKENEVIPAITPLGYINENSSLRDKIIKKIANSDFRKPWEKLFFNNTFDTPLEQEILPTYYKEALSMLRLAPSASNRQPWRILKQGDTFHFYLKRTIGYDKLFGIDLQAIDIGIAMLHFDLTLKEFGIFGNWKNLPNQSNSSLNYIVSWTKE